MISNKIGCLAVALFVCSACDSDPEHIAMIYPGQESASFQQFTRQCSSCHRPPMPDVHIAKAWPAVLARMQQHKEQRGLLVMNDREQQQILGYLQTYAKKDR